ncbi:MAG: phosphoribulokinase [Solirubrobacteraceae bacterium]
MARPVMLGLVGDSAAGKTTITRGLVRVLGEEHVTHVCLDDYHRYDREQRAERKITPLDPACNHLDVMEQDLLQLRRGRSILKPVYKHADGTFGPPIYIQPKRFTIVEGLLGFHNKAMCEAYDLRIFLAPPEDLRRHWKVQRDCSRRGYSTDDVLAELDRREADSERYIRPQARKADVVITFQKMQDDEDPERLDAELLLRDRLPHPDLAPFTSDGKNGIVVTERQGEQHVRIPGTLSRERGAEIEEAIWDKLHFARHLRSMRLGEFTIGTQLHRSDPLALVQLLILHHLVTACAAVALGRDEAADEQEAADSVPA